MSKKLEEDQRVPSILLRKIDIANLVKIATTIQLVALIFSISFFAAASPTLYYHFEPKFYVNFRQPEVFLNCDIYHTS